MAELFNLYLVSETKISRVKTLEVVTALLEDHIHIEPEDEFAVFKNWLFSKTMPLSELNALNLETNEQFIINFQNEESGQFIFEETSGYTIFSIKYAPFHAPISPCTE